MKKLKSLLAGILICALLLAPCSAIGEGAAPATTAKEISTLKELKTAFATAGSYKLMGSFTLDDPVDVASQAVTLDLNGNTISATLDGGANGDNSGNQDVAVIDVRTGGSLIINDTSTTSAGKITNAGKRPVIFVAGELTLNGGTVEATDNQVNGNYAVKTYGRDASLGKVTMTGGKMTSAGDTVIWNNGGEVSISGGEVVGPTAPTTGDRMTVKSQCNGAKKAILNISGTSKVTAKNAAAVELSGCDFTMSGGNVKATYDITPASNVTTAILTSSAYLISTMNISDGTISAPTGIYDMFAYQESLRSVINISGTANITGTAGNGVQSNGTVTVSGGTIISLTDYAIQGQYPGEITLKLENSKAAYSTSRFYGGSDGTKIVYGTYTKPIGYKISQGTLPSGGKDCHYLTKDSEITFNTHGGEAIAAVQVENGQKLEKPTATPTRAGYVFDGWYKEQAGTNPWDFDAEITKPEEIHAKWTEIPKYALTVTGGTGSGSYAEGTSVTIKANSKPGYVFVGWTVPDGVIVADKTKEETTLTMPANDVMVTAGYIFIDYGGNDNKTPIIIDGKSENIGKTEETWDETSVTIDQKELDKKLETAKENGSLLVPLADNRENASAKLLLKNIEDLAAKNSTLTLRRGETDYIMPATALDTRALMAELGATDPALVPLTISISRPRETVDVSGSEVLAPPISFTFSASYGGKTIEVSSFERFVSRCVEISETQAKRITTAIVFEEDGTYRHVPTNVFKKGDAWFANISSLTNSKYVLIFNEKKFADTQGKWYEAAVREMADRKIIAGVDEQIFAGDRSVSRAEFAALAVRALGLPAEGRAEFSDVPAGAWYSGAVAVAAKYGIVSGVGGGLFLPEASISRQEAMSMLQRAAKLAEFTQTPPVDMSFTDMDKVSDWARSAVEFNLGNHLIVGDGGKIRPQDEITRGETACVLLRLLQKAKLIDPRTEI